MLKSYIRYTPPASIKQIDCFANSVPKWSADCYTGHACFML